MAKCEEGYLCQICGRDVETLAESSVYLQYVIGELDPELLHVSRECHVRCNPILAQFIIDERFPPISAEAPWDKRLLDPAFVAEREQLVTRGFRRLWELQGQDLPLLDYPLPDVRERYVR